MMKKLLSLFLVALLALAAVACSPAAPAAEPESQPAESQPADSQPAAEAPEEPAAPEGGIPTLQRLLMVTGGDAGTYYALGGVVANVLTEKVDNLEVTATTSGASAANARALNNGEAELAILQNDVLGYAYEGVDSMADDGAMPKLRAIAGMYPEVIQLVALKSSGINTIADLKGKKVCVGDAGSGSEVNAKQILAAAGLSYDDFDVQYLSFSEASTAMQNGTVDAAFATSALPNTAIVELSNMAEVVVVPIDDATADALVAAHPFYAKTTIGADVYNVAAADSVAIIATLACTEDMDEEVAYQITKALFEQKEAIAAGHTRGNDLDIAKAADGITVPFHPGAVRYYAEQGITVE
ncbi:MAG: TAXI family TRAP transporter solute-binding subunit [Clostridia bacterium]|nr:TAXI family TRAP transporter solute-binding subunit [Candidatus Pelethousia sp.]NCB30339.1 TAXI family TRAP transporter solute-binding subunit [Clostridia bacterium]